MATLTGTSHIRPYGPNCGCAELFAGRKDIFFFRWRYAVPPLSLLRFQGLSRRGGAISSGRASDHSRRGAKISLYRKIASFQASAGKHLPRANIDTREWVNILTPVKQTAAYQLTGSKTDIHPTVLCT